MMTAEHPDTDTEKTEDSNHNTDSSNNSIMGNGSTRKRRSTSDGVKGQEGSGDGEISKDVIESQLQQAISQTWVVPDGGYGWVVMMCSLVISVIVDGVTYTFGVFLDNLEEEFQQPKSTITLANSLQVGLYLISGPVVSALINRYGCRPVVIAGSIVVFVAFIACSFSPNIGMFIFTYGVVGGIGFGMMYLPSVVAVSIFFDKKRALATGIAVCGSGIGTFVLAPLCEILIEEYNWRWTMILLGGLVLNGILCGALIRPLEIRFDERSAKVVDIRIEEGDNYTLYSNNRDNESVTSRNNKNKSRSSSNREIPESIPLITLTDDAENTQVIIPPQSEKKKNTGNTLSPSGQSDSNTTESISRTATTGQTTKFFSSTPNFSVVQQTRSSEIVPKRQKSDSLTGNEMMLGVTNSRNRSNTVSQMKLSPSGSRDSSSSRMGSRTMSHAPIGLAFIGVSDMHINKIRDEVALPVSRRDIHRSMAQMELGATAAGGSMKSLDSQMSCVSYGDDDDVTKKSKGLWGCLPESARDTFEEMMNFGIFEEKRYWFVIAGNFICMIGFYVPFVYIPGKASEMGFSDEKAAFLISIIGITNLIGRVVTGVLVNYLPIQPVVVTTIALALGGVVTMVCPFCETYAGLVAIAAIFGLCVAAYISLCSILLCELLGVRNLTNAFGYVILFRGIACIMGPPIAGALIDATGHFDPAFYVGGGMIVLGSVCHLLLLTPCIKNLKSSQ